MSVNSDKFSEAMSSSKIPILILDNKWHRLFGKMNPTKEIKSLEAELAELLKKQGKLVNQNKDLKKIKNNLMSEIVANMDDSENKDAADRKLSDNKRLINDANKKLEENEEVLMELPREIDRINKQLMLETMELCYERLRDNTLKIEEIGEWIKEIRIQLKKNIVKKQDMEIYNSELYSYMHDIFGPIVMELFDMKYIPTIHRVTDITVDNSNVDNKKDDSAH